MTAKRFTVDDGLEDVLCWEINDKENENMTCGECAKLLNELHEENIMLRSKHTQLILLLKSIVDDLKRMDTKGYAEHIEKIGNIKFLSMEDLE